MKKHPNYEVAADYAEIANKKRDEIPNLKDAIFIAASNKLSRKPKCKDPIPEELIELNGSQHLVLENNKVWYRNTDWGLNIIVDQPSSGSSRKTINRFNDIWDQALAQSTNTPSDPQFQRMVFIRPEPSGGDLFAFDPSESRLLGWYRWEIKTGETSAASMPLNSLNSASQAIHGDVQHIIADGLICLEREVLTVEERDAAILVGYLEDRFGSLEEARRIASRCEEKVKVMQANGTIRPIPMVHYQPSSKTMSTYTITGTSIASRTTNLKLTTLNQNEDDLIKF